MEFSLGKEGDVACNSLWFLGESISQPWTNTWEIQKHGKEVPGSVPPLTEIWTMKYLTGIGSLKSLGDIIPEQMRLPIKNVWKLSN